MGNFGRNREERGGSRGFGGGRDRADRGSSRGFGGRDRDSGRGRGGFGGGRSGGFGRDRPRAEMHDATCDKCKKECQVPFRPSGDKPVLCSDCFRGQGNTHSVSGNAGGSGSGITTEQFKELNIKLDKILKILEQIEFEEDIEEGEEDEEEIEEEQK